MTFNPAVPLNSDSPSIFPAQNQTNMNRLQTLLGADHQFNLSVAANDGYHNLVHLTQQAPSGALPATGRLYVKSSGGSVQLFYMDDAGTEYKVTPFYDTAPMKINGNQTLGMGASVTVLSVAYDFTGFGTVYIGGTNTQITYNFMRSGASTDINMLDSNGVSSIFLTFLGTDLIVGNLGPASQDAHWSLMVNRL